MELSTASAAPADRASRLF